MQHYEEEYSDEEAKVIEHLMGEFHKPEVVDTEDK